MTRVEDRNQSLVIDYRPTVFKTLFSKSLFEVALPLAAKSQPAALTWRRLITFFTKAFITTT